MLERDDFGKRYQSQPIAIHEFLYPLAQGYDSVTCAPTSKWAGPTRVQPSWSAASTAALRAGAAVHPTLPLLEVSTASTRCQSLDNYVGITEPPTEIFQEAHVDLRRAHVALYDLLSFRPRDIAALKRECADSRNPRDAKVAFAQEIVARFHSKAAADAALAEFDARFRGGAMPENIDEVILQTNGRPADRATREASGIVDSTSEALSSSRSVG
jgi:tyrosyl-tRNA synthetase